MAFNYNGTSPTSTKYSSTNLDIVRYNNKVPLFEVKRATTSQYPLSSMNSYMGLLNDTWGNISNASELQNHIGEFVYMEFIITDTNQVARVILELLSVSGNVISTNNVEWGYIDSHAWDWSIGIRPIWGRPYTLSISQGSNTTVTVTRVSSPNQGASTGTLSSGSVVYYGDVLKITGSANSSYNLSTFTVNGSSFTSGNTITVTSAVSVVTTAVASKSWKTVWTGTSTIAKKWSTSQQTVSATGLSGLRTGVSTRITGYFPWYEENNLWEFTNINFTLNLNECMYQKTTSTSGSASDFTTGQTGYAKYCYIMPTGVSTSSITFQVVTQITSPVYCIIGNNSIMLAVTKIEQYY